MEGLRQLSLSSVTVVISLVRVLEFLLSVWNLWRLSSMMFLLAEVLTKSSHCGEGRYLYPVYGYCVLAFKRFQTIQGRCSAAQHGSVNI